jgi:two-component system cell cycle sensor histidine kinase/response regulator CckA
MQNLAGLPQNPLGAVTPYDGPPSISVSKRSLFSFSGYLAGLLLVTFITLADAFLQAKIVDWAGPTVVRPFGILYVLPVAVIGVIWTRRHSLFTLALSLACLYFFFLAPRINDQAFNQRGLIEMISLAVVGSSVVFTLDALRRARIAVSRTAIDLTGALSELQAQKEFLRQVLDTDPNLIFVKDDQGRFSLANAATAAVYGVTTSEIVGKTDAELNVDSENVEHFERDDALVRDGRRDLFIPEESVTTASGEVRWLQTVKRPLVMRDGSDYVHVLGIATDITERKRAEEQVRAQQAFLRSVIDTAPNLIHVKDAEGKFTLVNKAFADFYGATPEEMVGKSTSDYHRDPENIERFLREDSRVQQLGLDEYLPETPVTAPDGEVHWFQIIKRPLMVPNGSVSVLGISTNITAQKQLQTQLIHSEKLAAVGQLIAGVVHEINNPLTVIYSSAQLLQMHGDPEVGADARTIREMADRMAKIVRSLLTFSRGGDGSLRSATALSGLIQSTLEICTFTLRTEEVEIETHLDADIPAIFVNGNQIQQVLLNLVTNAAHALRQNPPADRRIVITTSEVRGSGERLYARVTVADNGCGMSESVRKRIFEPFFTTKDTGEGTGLGLSICHGIVKAHGGNLSVTSEPGQGTTFMLDLPVSS